MFDIETEPLLQSVPFAKRMNKMDCNRIRLKTIYQVQLLHNNNEDLIEVPVDGWTMGDTTIKSDKYTMKPQMDTWFLYG